VLSFQNWVLSVHVHSSSKGRREEPVGQAWHALEASLSRRGATQRQESTYWVAPVGQALQVKVGL
jgi:hypothetical protein